MTEAWKEKAWKCGCCDQVLPLTSEALLHLGLRMKATPPVGGDHGWVVKTEEIMEWNNPVGYHGILICNAGLKKIQAEAIALAWNESIERRKDG